MKWKKYLIEIKKKPYLLIPFLLLAPIHYFFLFGWVILILGGIESNLIEVGADVSIPTTLYNIIAWLTSIVILVVAFIIYVNTSKKWKFWIAYIGASIIFVFFTSAMLGRFIGGL